MSHDALTPEPRHLDGPRLAHAGAPRHLAVSRPDVPRTSREPQLCAGARLLIQAVSLVALGLLLVPPTLRAKLWKIGISSFRRGGGNAREDRQGEQGRNDGLHDRSP